jgi:hypothetical protein
MNKSDMIIMSHNKSDMIIMTYMPLRLLVVVYINVLATCLWLIMTLFALVI